LLIKLISASRIQEVSGQSHQLGYSVFDMFKD
jgi:hypothetical protein